MIPRKRAAEEVKKSDAGSFSQTQHLFPSEFKSNQPRPSERTSSKNTQHLNDHPRDRKGEECLAEELDNEQPTDQSSQFKEGALERSRERQTSASQRVSSSTVPASRRRPRSKALHRRQRHGMGSESGSQSTSEQKSHSHSSTADKQGSFTADNDALQNSSSIPSENRKSSGVKSSRPKTAGDGGTSSKSLQPSTLQSENYSISKG